MKYSTLAQKIVTIVNEKMETAREAVEMAIVKQELLDMVSPLIALMDDHPLVVKDLALLLKGAPRHNINYNYDETLNECGFCISTFVTEKYEEPVLRLNLYLQIEGYDAYRFDKPYIPHFYLVKYEGKYECRFTCDKTQEYRIYSRVIKAWEKHKDEIDQEFKKVYALIIED